MPLGSYSVTAELESQGRTPGPQRGKQTGATWPFLEQVCPPPSMPPMKSRQLQAEKRPSKAGRRETEFGVRHLRTTESGASTPATEPHKRVKTLAQKRRAPKTWGWERRACGQTHEQRPRQPGPRENSPKVKRHLKEDPTLQMRQRNAQDGKCQMPSNQDTASRRTHRYALRKGHHLPLGLTQRPLKHVPGSRNTGRGG